MSRPLASFVVSSLVITLAPSLSSRAQGPTDARVPAVSQERAPAKPVAAIADLLRYEPTGLSLLRPYTRGKIPVVFIHGLWSNPWSWDRMIAELEADPSLADRYQSWTFGYSTGDPIPYSASLLRRDLQEVRRKFDPDDSDAAFNRMVLVGHSMGGLLTKMMVQDSGTRLWRLISDRPIDDARGRAGGSRPLPPGVDLRAAAGGPPCDLHRHSAPRQPGRPGIAPAPRIAAGPPARPAAVGLGTLTK